MSALLSPLSYIASAFLSVVVLSIISMSSSTRLPSVCDRIGIEHSILEDLSAGESIAFKEFARRCEEGGLRGKAAGCGTSDLSDGINDDATLL